MVLRQSNLDDASLEHLFFHVGNDNFIAYFVPKEEIPGIRYKPAQPGSGGMNHLAIDVEEASFDTALERLRAEGVPVHGPIDRGYERSIHFKDPNGVRLELLVWLTPPPAELTQAAILRRAQQVREARGAAYIEDADIRQAIAELRAPRAAAPWAGQETQETGEAMNDRVTDASSESFPACDAPGWMPQHL